MSAGDNYRPTDLHQKSQQSVLRGQLGSGVAYLWWKLMCESVID